MSHIACEIGKCNCIVTEDAHITLSIEDLRLICARGIQKDTQFFENILHSLESKMDNGGIDAQA